MTQNNLGTAYRALAGYRDPVENLERAITAYTQALRFRTEERSPLDHAMTQNNLGKAYRDQGNLVKASISFESALAVYRRIGNQRAIVAVLMTLCEIYRKLRLKEKSLMYAKELENTNIDAASLWNMIGSTYSTFGEHEKALHAFTEAIRSDSTEAMLYRNRASELIYLGNWGLAEADLDEAEKLDPDNAFLKGRRGDFAFWQGRFDEAVMRYEEAIQLKDDPGWNFGLALAQTGLGTIETARKTFQHAIDSADEYDRKDFLDELRRARGVILDCDLLNEVERELTGEE